MIPVDSDRHAGLRHRHGVAHALHIPVGLASVLLYDRYARLINMRKLKDALRLKLAGQQSHHQIAAAFGISKGVVTKYVGLAVAARLDLPAIAAMNEPSLQRRHDWVQSGYSVLITGPTGAGKSWLACVLAQYACRRGY